MYTYIHMHITWILPSHSLVWHAKLLGPAQQSRLKKHLLFSARVAIQAGEAGRGGG